MQTKLESVAKTDPLTNLLNRRGMEEKLTIEKARFERSNKTFSIILSDIDFFKKINDNHGHDAGDYILIETAKILEYSSRKQDEVCRWGGEEFLIVLPDTSMKGAVILAEKIRSAIEQNPFQFDGHTIPLTMSFGVQVFLKDLTINDCIKKADGFLYVAKEKGRNQVISP